MAELSLVARSNTIDHLQPNRKTHQCQKEFGDQSTRIETGESTIQPVESALSGPIFAVASPVSAQSSQKNVYSRRAVFLPAKWRVQVDNNLLALTWSPSNLQNSPLARNLAVLRNHDVLRDTIRQRCQKREHRDERDEVNTYRDPSILAHIRSRGGHPPHTGSRYGDRVVD
jgi:hypothetical protein